MHENSVIRTRISSLYVSQTSSVVLSTHNCVLNTKIKRLYWFQPSPVVLCMVFACKTAHFGPEFQFSMGPSPHLRFLHAKQRVLAQNYKSLWVPDLTCPCVQSKRRDLHQTKNHRLGLGPTETCNYSPKVIQVLKLQFPMQKTTAFVWDS